MRKSESTRHRLATEHVPPADRRPRLRAVRNGLPEFRPYVYRGTGEDQCEETAEKSGPPPGRRVS